HAFVNNVEAGYTAVSHKLQGYARTLLDRDCLGLNHYMRCCKYFGQIDVLDEALNILVGWLHQYFFWRSDLHDAAVLHQSDLIADSKCLVQVMRNKYDRFFIFSLVLNQFALR